MSPPSRRHLAPPATGDRATGYVAVEKVEGFIKQLAADQVLVIVGGGGLCLM